MKLHDIERALKKFTSIAQVAGRKLKEKQQQAAEADEKAHQAKMKFKHARREFKGARKAARRKREEMRDAQKAAVEATARFDKTMAKLTKASKKTASGKGRAKDKPAARAGNNVPRRTKGNRPPQPELSFKLKPLAEVSKRKA